MPRNGPHKSEGLRSIHDISTDLSKPIPDRLLQSKSQGGTEITFVPWHRAQRLLEFYTNGFWEYHVKSREVLDGQLCMTVEITIWAEEGSYSREGTGIEDTSVDSWGDPQSNAESMAFRRAAARWGLGLHLYDN